MKFLAARKILREFGGGEPLRLLFGTSGTADPFGLYLEAAGAEQGRAVTVGYLPFGTLRQHLLGPPPSQAREIFLLLPWDFAPETDWRSGVPLVPRAEPELEAEIATVGALLARRAAAVHFYLPAPHSPLGLDPARNAALAARIEAEARSVGARILPAEAFSLSSYLGSGCPVGGAHLGTVSQHVIAATLRPRRESKKVLVTDFDDVLWSGVLAEDGVDGIDMGPDGRGYRHFVFQSFLVRLRRDGVLLAGVTRNAPDVVEEVFRHHAMRLQQSDFVAVLASYGAKSAQIRHLAESLNLGLDSFVFVDDNPVEVSEVSGELPAVTVRAFPARDDLLPSLLTDLVGDFARETITDEDRERTELYRRRLTSIVPSDLAGGDLTGFLRDLRMTLTIHDRCRGDRVRAVQLINKTNQFNLNGRRFEDREVEKLLAAGGRLFGASLADRTGTHGEILSCLVDASGTIQAFVLSCRVFQRRVEHAFLAWLCAESNPPRRMEFAETPKNEPFRRFLAEPGLESNGDAVAVDPVQFRAAHAPALDLFTLVPPVAHA